MKKFLLIFVILSFMGCDILSTPEKKTVPSETEDDPPPAGYDGPELAPPGLLRNAPINVKAKQVGQDIHITWEMPPKTVEPRVFVLRYQVKNPQPAGHFVYYWSVTQGMDQNNPDYVIVNPRSAIVKNYSPSPRVTKQLQQWDGEWIYYSPFVPTWVHYNTRTFDVMVSAIYWGDDRYIDLIFPNPINALDDGREHLSRPYALNYTFE